MLKQHGSVKHFRCHTHRVVLCTVFNPSVLLHAGRRPFLQDSDLYMFPFLCSPSARGGVSRG